MSELEVKTERLVRIASDHQVGGIVIGSQAGFSWLTGGGTNRIDGSQEKGSGALFVRSDGRRFVIANAIEMPRLVREVLGHGWEPIEYPWIEDHATADVVVRLATRTLDTPMPIGADSAIAAARPLERPVAAARAPLVPSEVERYRALGAAAGTAIAEVARRLEPGVSEQEIARRIVDAAAALQGRATVVLVAADGRIARFRHPVPTDAVWRRAVMLVACIQRDGLVVAVSRIVTAGRPDDELERRTGACARVFESLLDATRPGARGAELFTTACDAYARAGFPEEERRHHQGGAIGYRSREWIAHPASEERVQERQAFAWNPSITGTKVEDTALVSPSGVEIITGSPGWPTIPIEVQGRTLHAAGLLSI